MKIQIRIREYDNDKILHTLQILFIIVIYNISTVGFLWWVERIKEFIHLDQANPVVCCQVTVIVFYGFEE